MMRLADLRDHGVPLLIHEGPSVAVFGVFKVRESRRVVLALLRVENAHAQRPEELGGHLGMRFDKALSRGFGDLVAETLERTVARLLKTTNETFRFLGFQKQLDEGPEVAALSGVHRLRVP